MATKIQIQKTAPPKAAKRFDPAYVHVARFDDEDARRAWFRDALKALLKVKTREVIAIKPDLSAPMDGDSGVTTQRWMIEETIRWVKRKRGEPILICAPQTPYTIDEVLDHLDLRGLCQETSTECVDPRIGTMPLRPLKHDQATGRIYHVQISTLAADGIVLLPKLKTARRDTVELSTWSLLSFLSQRDLFGAYKRGVIDDLLELHRRYESRIRACFVDGTVGLEAGGPVSGDPVPMNVLIAGNNPIAVDGVAAMTMGFDPDAPRDPPAAGAPLHPGLTERHRPRARPPSPLGGPRPRAASA
jgi:uncharacterized protein (DUF362 family)